MTDKPKARNGMQEFADLLNEWRAAAGRAGLIDGDGYLLSDHHTPEQQDAIMRLLPRKATLEGNDGDA